MHTTLARHADKLFGRQELFDRESLRSRGLDPTIAEKAVHAYEYVAQLVGLQVPFVFIGGTAAQLLLAGSISRLSKDVDILAPEGDRGTWIQVARDVSARFDGEVYQAKEEHREHGGLAIPALHFVVSYPTVVPSSTTHEIELDVVFTPIHFPTQATPLSSRIYTTKAPVTVRTPTAEGLFGGKLSTLGPSTIGIPRDKANYDLAVAKQLFDLGHLLQLVRDIGPVAEAYSAAYQQQAAYHPSESRPSLVAAIDDAMYTLKVLAAPPNVRVQDPQWRDDLKQLSQGVAKLQGYTGKSDRFDRLAARQAASQISLALALVRRILVEDLPPSEAHMRWADHKARIDRAQRDEDAVSAAKNRLGRIPWEERPHLNIKEFVQAVGPKALLYWDATFQETQTNPLSSTHSGLRLGRATV